MTRRWPPPLWLLLPLSVLTLGLAVLGLALSELNTAANRFTDDAALQHTQSLAAFTAQQVEGALRRDEPKAAAAATHGLNLDRDIGVAALVGPADVIIDATDFSLVGDGGG